MNKSKLSLVEASVGELSFDKLCQRHNRNVKVKVNSSNSSSKTGTFVGFKLPDTNR